MYKIIATAILFVTGFAAVAQNNFEGKITYKMSFSMEEANSTIVALFDDQKIKVVVTQDSAALNRKEDLLIDFKNGIFYKITNHNKTYTVDSLKKSKNDIFSVASSLVAVAEKHHKVLGYQTSAFTLPPADKAGSSSENLKVTFWYADSLLYKVPEKYASIEMVPLFTNGTSIGLGMKIFIQTGQDKTDSSEFTTLSVEPKKVPDSMLELPIGYTIAAAGEVMPDADQVTYDTTVMAIDTAYAPPAKRSAKKTNKPAQKKQDQNQKGTPNKPKSAVRKPGN